MITVFSLPAFLFPFKTKPTLLFRDGAEAQWTKAPHNNNNNGVTEG